MNDRGRSSAVVIGCSTGGLKALRSLLGALRADLAAPVIVVCHRGSTEDREHLVELLAQAAPMPVQEPDERSRVRPNVVHLAPSGYHLLIEADETFMLSVDARVNFSRPAIDVLFESAAAVYRERLLAAVLTGANDDGAIGLKAVRARGGHALVQSPEEAEADRMPRAALQLAGADAVLTLAGIADRINQRCP